MGSPFHKGPPWSTQQKQQQAPIIMKLKPQNSPCGFFLPPSLSFSYTTILYVSWFHGFVCKNSTTGERKPNQQVIKCRKSQTLWPMVLTQGARRLPEPLSLKASPWQSTPPTRRLHPKGKTGDYFLTEMEFLVVYFSREIGIFRTSFCFRMAILMCANIYLLLLDPIRHLHRTTH